MQSVCVCGCGVWEVNSICHIARRRIAFLQALKEWISSFHRLGYELVFWKCILCVFCFGDGGFIRHIASLRIAFLPALMQELIHFIFPHSRLGASLFKMQILCLCVSRGGGTFRLPYCEQKTRHFCAAHGPYNS